MNAYNSLLARTAVVGACMLFVSLAASGDPSVPGYVIEEYATVDTPGGLAFDPSGVLYVGNLGPGTISIHRVALGGSPVQDYGPPVFDPDGVAFDPDGAISGIPGAVLVGGGTGPGAPPPYGYVMAIAPDQSGTYLFGSPTKVFRNPSVMKLDNSGRLLFTDPRSASEGFVYATSGGIPVALYNYGAPYVGLTVDSANRIYTCNQTGKVIQIHDESGILVDPSFATYSAVINVMEFAPPGPVWKGGLYGSAISTGELLSIDDLGNVDIIGSGFNQVVAVAFGPHDGSMYLSDYGTNRIYRITGVDTDQEVALDFKPGNRRNVINPRSRGRFWLAILSDAKFDALQVEPKSVTLGPGQASPDRYRVKDVNRDRVPDLMLRFRTPQVGLQCGDTEVELTGETYAGDSIIGTDAVKTAGCKKPKKSKRK